MTPLDDIRATAGRRPAAPALLGDDLLGDDLGGDGPGPLARAVTGSTIAVRR